MIQVARSVKKNQKYLHFIMLYTQCVMQTELLLSLLFLLSTLDQQVSYFAYKAQSKSAKF